MRNLIIAAAVVATTFVLPADALEPGCAGGAP
jgi:hypothetical protein